MKSSVRISTVLAVLTFGVLASSGPSFGVQTLSTATRTVDSVAIQSSIESHEGVLTQSEAARLGVHADAVYLDTPQVRALYAAQRDADLQIARNVTSTTLAATPRDASGCNLEVCIEVIGSGLTVNNWNTVAYTTGPQCSFAGYWEGGQLAFTGKQLCGDGVLETFASNFDGPFDNGEQVCNTWVDIAGKPCETIHS